MNPLDIIEIKNVSFANKGAELMLIAVDRELKKIDPSAKIALQPGKRSPFSERIQFGAYQKIGGTKGFLDWSWIGELIPELLKRNLGLVTDSGLSGIFDASGYAYGGDWNPAMLRQAARQASLMKKKGGFYILMPQAFGVFDTQHKITKIRELVNSATIVFARDEQSRKYLDLAEVDLNKVHISPDFTAIVPPQETEIPSVDYACVVPNAKLISRMNKNVKSREDYIAILARCIEHLRKIDILPIILYHHSQDDHIVCEKLASKLDCRAMINAETDPMKLKFILGHANVNICSRYHACISSLSQGVPTIATSWSHKYDMLYQDYGVPELLIEDHMQITNVIDGVMTGHEKISGLLNHTNTKIKAKILTMWDKIAEVMRPPN